MDACLPDWNSDVGAENPSAPPQKRPLGLENELVELLWQNGEIVMNSQNNRKSKQVSDRTSLAHDDETASWMIDCPIDESFERDFYSNFVFEIPSFDEPEKNLETNHVVPVSQPRQDFPPPPPPPPKFPASRADHEGSGMTLGSSHCASNQVVNEVEMSRASSSGLGSRAPLGADEAGPRRVNECAGPAFTCCSGGSGGSSMWKTSSQSNETNRHKRKSRDAEESECPSDATELESGKASQKSGTTRRSRVAEVHNLSERRRRDRINEKMRALQDLIPNANKSDKASMLDEAIEYMKSLQLQIQLMWMGRGMAPMMLPGMQHYMSRVGMGIGPPIPIPAIQNLMRLSRLPLVDQSMNLSQAPNQAQIGHNPMLNPVHYQNHIQNPGFQEQYANYMNFHSMQNASPQATNVFNFGFHAGQQNPVSAPQSNGDK